MGSQAAGKDIRKWMDLIREEFPNVEDEQDVNEEIKTNYNNTMYNQIEDIAKYHFYVDTLETRRHDSKDFYEVAIWSIKSALEEAWKQSFQEGQKSNNA